MFATLFTDASWCPTTHLAGWAAWAKTEGFQTLRRSGVVARTVETAGEAEVVAIVKGLDAVVDAWRGFAREPIDVLVQSDCLEALMPARWPGYTRERYEYLCQVELGRVTFRHVRGHRGKETPRNAVNSWCDAEAKRMMRAARETAKNAYSGSHEGEER